MTASLQPAYQRNGESVSPSAFYALACDPRRSVAVQACAGAGKTWMLVSRIIRALLESDGTLQPHEILAITFTKKAAGEMRQRLNDWLTDFAKAPLAHLEKELLDRGFAEEIGRLRLSEAASLLQNLYQTVLHAERPVQIRTFHGWFAALLRSAPLALLQSLKLPAVYELLEDDTEAIALVWSRYFERLTQEPAPLADFHAAVVAHGRHQTLRALDAALTKRIEFTLADAHGVVESSVKPFGDLFTELAGLATPDEALLPGGAYHADLALAAVSLGRAGAKTFVAKGDELAQALACGDGTAVLKALLTNDGSPRKFSDRVPDIASVRVAQGRAQRLQAAWLQQAAWLHQQRMVRLTRVLIDEFANLKRERGWIDMNDVERAAQAMLSNPEIGGWLQQRLDARVRHLLIDEFQDTSPLQWQTLSTWLSSYAGSGGGGEAPRVFIVGDPKQSIYRFRRAEPQVFLAAQAFVREALGGDLLSCDHTRRNATGIVATVNQVMGNAQKAGSYAGFREHTTGSATPGSVRWLPAINAAAGLSAEDGVKDGDSGWRDSLTTPREVREETRHTLECRQAARWIANCLAQQPLSGVEALTDRLGAPQVMVLARRRSRLTQMEEALARLHIPASQPEKSRLGDAPEVQDIVALLDVLLSGSNDLALAQALKSPLFGCTDDDLIGLALLRREARQRPVHNGRADEPGEEHEGPDAHGQATREAMTVAHADPVRDISWFALLGRAKHGATDWPALVRTLTRWQAWLAKLPPHDALHAIFHDGDVLARFAAAAPSAARARVIANLQAMLFAALEFDGGRYATPYALVRALKSGRIKAPTSANAQAVQLLTVHGAKGLEAPLVLLLDTDSAPARAQTMGVLVEWPGEREAPTRFCFLASESDPPLCTAEALANERAERKREELNALYVAMTRAKELLVVSSVAPTRPDPESWWARIQPFAAELPIPDPDAALELNPVAPASGSDSVVSEATQRFLLPKMPLAHVQPTEAAIVSIADDEPQSNDISASVNTSASIRTRPVPRPGGDRADTAEGVLDHLDHFDLDSDTRIGQAMHRLLEWLPLSAGAAESVSPMAAQASGPGLDVVMVAGGHWSDRQLAAAALGFALDASQIAQAARMARTVREGAAAWAWDADLIDWHANEVPLTSGGQFLRIDRLVRRRDTGALWVLDYKSAAEPLDRPELCDQLVGYRRAVAALHPGQVVHAAFLTAQGRLLEPE